MKIGDDEFSNLTWGENCLSMDRGERILSLHWLPHKKIVSTDIQTEKMAEKYTLNWHTFSDHLKVMFKDLYQEGSHSDVTLVSDDQTQFKAHKIVLSACSPVFKKIIESNPSQHPLIYLRGIQSYEMESILQFMYLGD